LPSSGVHLRYAWRSLVSLEGVTFPAMRNNYVAGGFTLTRGEEMPVALIGCREQLLAHG
jgi:hypothetical protein